MIRKFIIVMLTLVSVLMAACALYPPFEIFFSGPEGPRATYMVAGNGTLAICSQTPVPKQFNPIRLRKWSFVVGSLEIVEYSLRSVTVTLSLPVLVAVFATYPAIAFIRGPLRRRRRRRNGWCVHCGYDLTGNVTGVCSECGAEFKA